jgi:hypothetical protein
LYLNITIPISILYITHMMIHRSTHTLGHNIISQYLYNYKRLPEDGHSLHETRRTAFFYHDPTAPVGQDLLITGDSRSHSDTPHSVGLLWTSDQPLPDNTQHSQKLLMSPAVFEPAIPASERPQRLATGRKVRGSNPGGGRGFPQPSRPTLGSTQSPIQWEPGLSRGLSGRGVALNTHPHLAPRLRKK